VGFLGEVHESTAINEGTPDAGFEEGVELVLD
jgi:hypothetical protein